MKEKSKYWKIYFWVLLIVTFPSGADINYSFLEIFFYIVVWLLGMLGLLAYIYQTPIFSQYFWVGVFLTNLLMLSYVTYENYNNWTEITEHIGINLVLWSYGVGFIFITPLLIALYSYAFNFSQFKIK